MNPRKIFISYSFLDDVVSSAIESALNDAGYEAHLNTGQLHTAEMHSDISRNLNACDVVVPIITANWLASHECRDELIRANERRKIIIPFLHAAARSNSSIPLPWYIPETLYVSWSDRDYKVSEKRLLEKLAGVHFESWKSQCYKYIRLIGDYVQRSEPISTWRSELCKKLLSTVTSHTREVLGSRQYKFPVASEHAYLNYAGPIFGQARTIIAIAIASISTFWTDPAFGSASGNYLTTQHTSAESIVRIFVFSSHREFLKFRPVLKKHHDAYGKYSDKSGVFICSTEAFRGLLREWSMPSHEVSMHQDFGLLSFGDTDDKMFATLDSLDFSFSVYKDDESRTNYRLVPEYVEALRSLGDGCLDPETRVIRWSPDWAQNDEQFLEASALMFKNEDASELTHLVFLRPEFDSPEVFSGLKKLVGRFLKHADELRISSVKLNRRHELMVSDHRFASPLITHQDFEYCLAMTFSSREALRHYYQHQIHSSERENLYILLNPGIERRFEEVSKLPSKEIHERSQLFAAIETLMTQGGYIQRMDVVSDD